MLGGQGGDELMVGLDDLLVVFSNGTDSAIFGAPNLQPMELQQGREGIQSRGFISITSDFQQPAAAFGLIPFGHGADKCH